MRKIYLTVLSILVSAGISSAEEGDTTTVVTHTETQLSWYGNYDTAVTFPDGSLDYRRINMEFVLGKYMCEGYDPANAGEGDGDTGWCGDWDYDVHVYVMNEAGDTLQLGELITPYANSTFPLFPWDWKQSYFFDVTDYYPILKNAATIRIQYSGYSGGFTGTVKFHFIEGTPPRDVVGYSKLWDGGYAYGNTDNPIDDNVAARTEHMPEDAVSAEMKLIISGHGGDATENCAEFCSKWYRFMVDEEAVNERDIWRDDCGANFLAPQSGTWIYQRANWCPGNSVNTIIEKVPASVAAGSDFNVDLDFEPYTSAGGALYKLAGTMFYYGVYNRAVDAGIEEIISPNNKIDYGKLNPICGAPVVKVKNYGGDTITSIKFQYRVNSGEIAEYTQATSIASMQDAEISLPALSDLDIATGSDNTFSVQIVAVNGAADEELFNDKMSSEFSGAPVWTGGNFRIHFRMSGPANGINRTNWKLIDVTTGATVASRNGTASNANYYDTIHVENGCYKLEVENEKGYGLSFFGSFTSGFIRAYDMATGTRLAMPTQDLGSSGLEGNFGTGFVHYFRVEGSTDISNVPVSTYSIDVYPNPAVSEINIDVVGTLRSSATVQLVNIMGQVVYSETTAKQNIKIPASHLPSGVYSLIYNSGDQRKVEKVVIQH